MDRVRAWLAAAPVIATGVLVAHELAYRLTATPTGSRHAYLEHAPQILVALTLVGVALAALTRSSPTPRLWVFPLAGSAAFVLQEHLEAVAHAGGLPFLVSSPAFVVGLLLQLPFAVAAWLLARALLGLPQEMPSRRARLERALLRIGEPDAPRLGAVPLGAVPGRSPPELLRR